MKKRLISAIIALMIWVSILLLGGLIFDIGILILSLFALREFLHSWEAKKELPMFINFISYILLALIVATGINMD